MRDSAALFSIAADVKTLVLFVHGWGGSAGESWDDFAGLAEPLAEMRTADALFFDYPTLTDSVSFAAKKFRVFLMDAVREPATAFIDGSLPAAASPRGPAFRYERIVVVAHSMGAVVVRRALLDGEKARPEERLTDGEFAKFRLLLFAPAHTGSPIPLLIASGLGLDFLPGAALVGSLLRLHFVSLRDLEEGSRCLQDLERDNAQCRAAREAPGEIAPHLRATVYHARGDKVVTQHDFDADYPFYAVMGRNHRSICKPAAGYLGPLDGLRKMFL